MAAPATPRGVLEAVTDVVAGGRRIGIVMPAYNEMSRIEQTIETIARYLRARSVDWPVVVADDGSTDRTVEVVEAAAARAGLPITVLSFPHRGKASTVRDAMLALADRHDLDYMLMLDADDELTIDQLDGVAWSPDPRTIYIGRRVGEVGGVPGARPPLLRRAMSWTLRLANRLLLGLPFPDTQCGFKLFPRRCVGALFGQQRSSGWVFDAELLVIAYRRSGLPIVEVPVVWRPRGASRVTTGAAVSSGLALLAIAWHLWNGGYEPIDAG